MKPGNLVRRKMYPDEVGLFMGMRTFKKSNLGDDYTCAEVMWFHTRASNGDVVSTIQHDLIEVIDENR